MYWICFGDSAKGTLKQARHDFAPEVAYDHILALLDNYSEGDIREVTDRATRDSVLALWRGDPQSDGDWRDELTERHFETLDRLDEVDEAVIWYSKGNALEQCGLRYVVSRLYARHIPVWVAEVDQIPVSELKEPDDVIGSASAVGVITDSRLLNFLLCFAPQPLLRRYARRVERRTRGARASGGIVQYGTVGEMEPGAAWYFHKHRRLLPETEKAQLLTDWKRLQEENAPLRAMVDGKLQSVGLDFYDEVILSCVPDKEKTAANTVGNALVKIEQQMGNRAGDMLIFSRIRALGAAGRLEIVQDAPNYRDMAIRKIRG